MLLTNKILRDFCYVVSICLIIIVFSGCGGWTQLRESGAATAPNALYTLPPGKFSKLWLQQTVKLSLNSNGTDSSPMMGGGQGSTQRGRPVPMEVTATYMDPELIHEGLAEFEELLHMTEPEKAEYEKRYSRQYDSENSHLFWLEITSTYSDEAFDIDKWTFYIQDEKGRSVEPDKITEDTVARPVDIFAEQPGLNSAIPERQKANYFRVNSKKYLISFTKKPGIHDIISEAGSLKVIFFEWSSRDMQREGVINLLKPSSPKVKGTKS